MSQQRAIERNRSMAMITILGQASTCICGMKVGEPLRARKTRLKLGDVQSR